MAVLWGKSRELAYIFVICHKNIREIGTFCAAGVALGEAGYCGFATEVLEAKALPDGVGQTDIFRRCARFSVGKSKIIMVTDKESKDFACVYSQGCTRKVGKAMLRFRGLLQGEGGGAVGGDGGGGVLKLLCCDVGDALGGFFARTYAAVVEQALGG